jgi:aminoglycoside/choline kinase family phosphotransferase
MNAESAPIANSTAEEQDPALESLSQALANWKPRAKFVGEMPGGASTRRFFRLKLDSKGIVAMYIPAPSQEIQKARQSSGTAPFVEVADLLRGSGVRVPKIFKCDEERNLLFVEDLGDDTLANYLMRIPNARLSLYQNAVRDLAMAQLALSPLPPESIVTRRAFDKDLLRWEIDHFADWALQERGIVLSERDRIIFDDCADYLATTIAAWERGFVHRDYQSRNLMVTEGAGGCEITWIDFQDAMMGPRAYDLVALLTDSYQTFSREFVEERLAEFCKERGIEEELEQLIFEFDLLTVQRKLKDAGRFIFLDRVNHNPNFLPFVDSTIEKARAALKRVKSHGPLEKLHELLTRLIGAQYSEKL